MTTNTETAILAGGCFWGMQDLLRRYPGVLQRASATPAAMYRMPLIATMATTPKRSKSFSTRR